MWCRVRIPQASAAGVERAVRRHPPAERARRRASDSEAILRALARELLRCPGARRSTSTTSPRPATERRAGRRLPVRRRGAPQLLRAARRAPAGRELGGQHRAQLPGRRQRGARRQRAAAGADRPVSCALLLPLAERGRGRGGRDARAPLLEAFDRRASSTPATLVDQAATALALVRARAEAGTDAVTGCMNHRAMRRRLGEEIDRATRSGGPLSCLLIDLDDFKLVNDRHGHAAGDAMLRERRPRAGGRVPRVRPRRPLRRRRVRRDPPERRAARAPPRRRPRARAAAGAAPLARTMAPASRPRSAWPSGGRR